MATSRDPDKLTDVLKKEAGYIEERRNQLKLKVKDYLVFEKKLQKLDKNGTAESRDLENDYVGLALSGGGIRSATFNLGLLQALAKQNILRFCDYLSTVSGGGYIGSCLSSLLNGKEYSKKDGNKTITEKPSIDVSGFPFRFDQQKGDERREVKYLRRHGNYLAPRKSLFSLDIWRIIALYLTGLVLTNLTTIGLTILILFGLHTLVVHTIGEPVNFALWLINISVAVLILVLILRWLATFKNLTTFQRKTRNNFLAGLTLAAALLAIGGGLTLLAVYLPNLGEQGTDIIKNILGGGAVASGISLLSGFIKSKNKILSSIKKVVFRFGWILIIPLALAWFIRYIWTMNDFEYQIYGIPVLFLIGLAALVFGFLTNTNNISMHHFYHDRLTEAYIIKRDGEEIIVDDNQRLHDLHKQGNGAPYHLINTTLNIPSCKNRYLRGRGADFFLFSKFYCGSMATGYRKTEHYEKGKTLLSTAMAVSGAAASPQMGQIGSPVLTFLLTLLNVRLNRYMPNPRYNLWGYVPLWPYYFVKELLNLGNDNDVLLNISDGGHYENLGVFELLRRQCKVIIASDCGADPEYKFNDFANLLRKARIDLGIDIKIDIDNLRLKDEIKRTSTGNFVSGVIEYPSGEKGLFIYIKSTLTGEEPEDLISYRRKNKDFPDETTADQFFDEAQFESYRELGYFTGKNIFS